jgi:hypothetical protein
LLCPPAGVVRAPGFSHDRAAMVGVASNEDDGVWKFACRMGFAWRRAKGELFDCEDDEIGEVFDAVGLQLVKLGRILRPEAGRSAEANLKKSRPEVQIAASLLAAVACAGRVDGAGDEAPLTPPPRRRCLGPGVSAPPLPQPQPGLTRPRGVEEVLDARADNKDKKKIRRLAKEAEEASWNLEIDLHLAAAAPEWEDECQDDDFCPKCLSTKTTRFRMWSPECVYPECAPLLRCMSCIDCNHRFKPDCLNSLSTESTTKFPESAGSSSGPVLIDARRNIPDEASAPKSPAATVVPKVVRLSSEVEVRELEVTTQMSKFTSRAVRRDAARQMAEIEDNWCRLRISNPVEMAVFDRMRADGTLPTLTND